MCCAVYSFCSSMTVMDWLSVALPYSSLSLSYVIVSRHFKAPEVVLFFLSLFPLLYLFGYLLQVQHLLKTDDKGDEAMKLQEVDTVLHIMLLIIIAHAVTFIKVTLLAELAWICCIGMLNRVQLNNLSSCGNMSYFEISVGLMLGALFIVINVWMLMRPLKAGGFQYQTIVSGLLMLNGLSVHLSLTMLYFTNCASLVAFGELLFAVLLYASAVFQHITEWFTEPLKKSTICLVHYVFSYSAYLCFVLLFIAKN